MNNQKRELIRSQVCAGSYEHKKRFLGRIEPIIDHYTSPLRPETPARERRKRIMSDMALEMLCRGCYPCNITIEKYLSDFFSEIFSVNGS